MEKVLDRHLFIVEINSLFSKFFQSHFCDIVRSTNPSNAMTESFSLGIPNMGIGWYNDHGYEHIWATHSCSACYESIEKTRYDLLVKVYTSPKTCRCWWTFETQYKAQSLARLQHSLRELKLRPLLWYHVRFGVTPKLSDVGEHLKPSTKPNHYQSKLVHLFYIPRGAAVRPCEGCIDTPTVSGYIVFQATWIVEQ